MKGKKLNANLDDKCHISHAYFPKVTGHRIWDYKISRRAWDFAIMIIDSMQIDTKTNMALKPFRLDFWEGYSFLT